MLFTASMGLPLAHIQNIDRFYTKILYMLFTASKGSASSTYIDMFNF